MCSNRSEGGGTISRHTTKLVRLGILDKRQRRPVRGIWQTCLYKLVSWGAWALAGIAGAVRKKRSKSHRVRPPARIASVQTEIVPQEGQPPRKNDLVASILKHGKTGAPTQDQVFTTSRSHWELPYPNDGGFPCVIGHVRSVLSY